METQMQGKKKKMIKTFWQLLTCGEMFKDSLIKRQDRSMQKLQRHIL